MSLFNEIPVKGYHLQLFTSLFFVHSPFVFMFLLFLNIFTGWVLVRLFVLLIVIWDVWLPEDFYIWIWRQSLKAYSVVLYCRQCVHGPASDAVHSAGLRHSSGWKYPTHHHHDGVWGHGVWDGTAKWGLHEHAAGCDACQPRTEHVQHAARTVEYGPGNRKKYKSLY